jgi:hypothetical protein
LGFSAVLLNQTNFKNAGVDQSTTSKYISILKDPSTNEEIFFIKKGAKSLKAILLYQQLSLMETKVLFDKKPQ